MKSSSMWLGVLALLAVSVGLIIFGSRNAQVASVAQGSQDLAAAVSALDHAKGATGTSTKATLVEYSDFECPACAAYAPVVKALVDEYKDQVQFVYRHFPLPQHLNAREAAYAAEAAGKQGKFFEMHDMIFAGKEEWTSVGNSKEVFKRYAEELGLNIDQYVIDSESKEVESKVEEDRLSGIKSGVRGTPTFFLNGKQIANPQTLESFKTILDEAIGTTTTNATGATTTTTQ